MKRVAVSPGDPGCICSRHRTHEECDGGCACLRPDPKFKQPPEPDVVGRDCDGLVRMAERLPAFYRKAHDFAYIGGGSGAFEARTAISDSQPTEAVLLDARRVSLRHELSVAWEDLDEGISKVRDAEKRIAAAFGGKVRRNRDGTPVRGPGMKEEEPPSDGWVSKTELKELRRKQGERMASGETG